MAKSKTLYLKWLETQTMAIHIFAKKCWSKQSVDGTEENGKQIY